MNAEQKTATAKDVHAEFDLVGKKLVQEAELILEKTNGQEQGLADKMAELGFANAGNITDAKKIKEAELIKYYNFHYPQNNFFPELEIAQICKKYGLLFANSNDFIGNIPKKNQEEILAFVLREDDKGIRIINSSKYKAGERLMKRNEERGFGYAIFGNMLLALKMTKFCKKISVNEWKKHQHELKARGFELDQKSNQPKPVYKIVATPDLLNLVGKQIVGEYKLIDNDPVAFIAVDGGYLQLSCWGEEVDNSEFKTHRKN